MVMLPCDQWSNLETVHAANSEILKLDTFKVSDCPLFIKKMTTFTFVKDQKLTQNNTVLQGWNKHK